ncbi:hypothetical protein [Amycolatopsis rubida]|uniref:hypothetical protein n=1 Tax=Amycolatopsis rubida TaxID=112413 RepID=UPI0011602CB9|nr:hypothetical protein [Amycolatopsis rubida]
MSEAAAALGHPVAVPALPEPRGCLRMLTRSGEHGPEAISCTVPDANLTVITERTDLRQLDLADAAAEALFGSWHYDRASDGDIEQWMRDRQRDAHDHASTSARRLPVDGHDRDGIYREHDGHAAWAADLGTVRVSISGPAPALQTAGLQLRSD